MAITERWTDFIENTEGGARTMPPPRMAKAGGIPGRSLGANASGDGVVHSKSHASQQDDDPMQVIFVVEVAKYLRGTQKFRQDFCNLIAPEIFSFCSSTLKLNRLWNWTPLQITNVQYLEYMNVRIAIIQTDLPGFVLKKHRALQTLLLRFLFIYYVRWTLLYG